MLMQVKPDDRLTFGLNAKKAWYTGPALRHYQAFRGVLPSTKGERISDTVKFQHHAIAMPELTPSDQILEATRQLKGAINLQPKRAPMDEMGAIDMLREVMMGEQRTELPQNSVQIKKYQQKKRQQSNDSHASYGGMGVTSMPLPDASQSERGRQNNSLTPAPPKRAPSPVSVVDNLEQNERNKS